MKGINIKRQIFTDDLDIGYNLLCEHHNVQVMTQTVPKNNKLYIMKSTSPLNVDFLLIQKGKVEIKGENTHEILEAGDSLSVIDLKEDVVMHVLEDLKTLYFTTEAIFNKISRELELMRDKLEDIDKKDHYTKAHCGRVCKYVEAMIPYIQDKISDLKSLVWAAQLHDIGKCKVPDEILLKPGRFEPEEFEMMKNHAQFSYDILRDRFGVDEKICRYAACHHERYDGTGYPNGLKGEEIPVEARIIAIADTFDAMTTTRPYQKARTPQEALEEMERFKHQYDPELFNIFKNLVEDNIIDPLKVPEEYK